jgi:hypothetical protein
VSTIYVNLAVLEQSVFSGGGEKVNFILSSVVSGGENSVGLISHGSPIGVGKGGRLDVRAEILVLIWTSGLMC